MDNKSSILSNYFCEKITLREYLTQLGVSSMLLSVFPNFIDSVVVAKQHGGSMFPQRYSLLCVFTLEDVIHHAIEHLLTIKSTNIITLGYNFIREGSKRGRVIGSCHLQMRVLNTNVTYLKTKAWEVFHNLIGDDVLFHLLCNNFLFLSVYNNCYIQLSGEAVSDLDIKKDCTKHCMLANHTEVKLNPDKKQSRNNSHDVEINVRKRKFINENSSLKKRKLNSLCIVGGIYVSEREDLRKKSCSSGKDMEPLLFNMNETGKQSVNTVTKQLKTIDNLNPTMRKVKRKITRRFRKRISRPVISVRLAKHSPAKIGLKRSKLFYSTFLVEGLSTKFVLCNTDLTNTGINGTMNKIFHFSKKEKIKRLPRYLFGFKGFIKALILKFKSCRFKRLLNYYCPLETWFKLYHKKNKRKKKQTGDAASELSFQERTHYKFAVKSFVPPYKVFLFLRRVINKCIPDLLWGSSHNKKIFLTKLQKFIMLGRYEKLTIEYFMAGIKTSKFNWLNSTPIIHTQQFTKYCNAITNLFLWLINDFIIPILCGYFYITESDSHKNKVFYYRKPIWNLIQHIGLRSIIGNVYEPISYEEVKKKLVTNQCLAVYKMRLIPGQNKIRPIAMMATSWEGKIPNKKVCINGNLRNLHLSLQYEIAKQKQLLGVTVSDSNEVFTKVKSLLLNIKSAHTNFPPLYFVSVDISRCFDTLPQEQILKLIPNILREDSYLIRRFVKIKIGQHGVMTTKLCKMASEGTDCNNFVKFICEGLKKGSIVGKNVIFIDKVYSQMESREKMLELLQKHLLCSIGKVGNKYLIRNTGVPQGSILASILNNLHYGNVENEYLRQFLTALESIMMRWVDDYLFITTSKHSAQRFVYTMHNSMSMFGCHINIKKTVLSFDLKLNQKHLQSVHGDLIPWCGYLINYKTFEFAYNYLQYVGENIKDGITIEYSTHPGLSTSRKLLQAVTVKATALIVDKTINSRQQVLVNIYQIFRFVALKFHVHVKAFSKGMKLYSLTS